jgi:hypothetical protein
LARAREDVTLLASVVPLFLYDTELPCFLADGGYAEGGFWGSPPSLNDENRIDVLFGNGDIPTLDVVDAPVLCANIDFWGWIAAFPPGTPGAFGPIFSDTIDNQLVYGNPLGSNPITGFVFDPNDYYARPKGNDYHGFRGPYLQPPVSADPWGNRYSINVAFLHSRGEPASKLFGCGFNVSEFLDKDVFVLSAGPDGAINTSFYVDNVVPQRDDIIAIISGRGRGSELSP